MPTAMSTLRDHLVHSLARIMAVLPALVLAALLGACGGGGGYGSTEPPPASPVLGSISATPSAVGSLFVGATVTVTVTARDAQGAVMSGASGYAFSSTNQAVATVTAAGVVQGIAVGSTTINISLTLGGVTRTTAVSVTVVPATAQTLGSLAAVPATIASLNVGATTTIAVQALDTQGNPIAGATGYVFTSTNQAVATVNAQGVVTGVAAGTSTINVSLTLAGVTRTASVGVTVVGTFPLAASVRATNASSFDPQNVEIGRGGTVTWIFEAVLHNVQFTAGTTGAPANIGDSSGESVSRTFNTAGTFNYVCSIHPGMSGSVAVR